MGDHGGFTLIELVVVMALMGIIIGFALPRFQRMADGTPTDEITQWIRFKSLALREKAQTQQSPWALVFDFDADEIRAVSLKPPPEDEDPPKPVNAEQPFPNAGRIVDVVLAPDQKHSSGEVAILFYPQGVADQAYIHLRDSEGDYRTLKIEPFLPRVKQFDEYISFEDS